jgi:hypothetical protein
MSELPRTTPVLHVKGDSTCGHNALAAATSEGSEGVPVVSRERQRVE